MLPFQDLWHKAQDVSQPLATNATSVAAPSTGSTCTTPRCHPDVPLEEKTTDKGIDVNPGPTTEEAEIARKVITLL